MCKTTPVDNTTPIAKEKAEVGKSTTREASNVKRGEKKRGAVQEIPASKKITKKMVRIAQGNLNGKKSFKTGQGKRAAKVAERTATNVSGRKNTAKRRANSHREFKGLKNPHGHQRNAKDKERTAGGKT